ncbi:MAG: hypothetical protein ACXVFN_09550 [Solirubrobacteraceae bacterium]
MQLEFPWALGPAPGRHVLRGHAGEIEHILVLSTLGAPRRRRVGARRARPADPAPAPVTTTRATLIDATAVDEAAARRWLAGAEGEAEAERAIAALNRLLHLQRVAAADPAAREVARRQALVVRVGYGEGEQVAEGRWTEALELPEPRARTRREAALRPQERLAALLGARDAALACEELALRARSDVDAGRRREAVLQLRTALDAALAELPPWRDRGDLAGRIAELEQLRPDAEAAAEAALRGGVDDEAFAAATRTLERLEAALRARTAAGFD